MRDNGNKSKRNSILVVDDEPSVLNMVVFALERFGYSAIPASHPDQAMEILARAETVIDIILTDFRMPGCTGLQLMGKIHAAFPEMLIILMTAYADMETTISAIKQHAFDFITKPIDFPQLALSLEKGFKHLELVKIEKDYKAMLEKAVVEKTRELLENMAELEMAKDAALEASRVKSEFLDNLSHELRTPMNGVLGMIGLTLDTDLSETQKEYLSLAQISAERMTSLIDNLLEFILSQGENGLTGQCCFSLRKEVSDSLKPLQMEAQEKNLAFTLTIDEAVEDTLIGNPKILTKTLNSLADNAVKFTDRGEIDVEVAVARREESALVLRFSVKDSGIGIAEDRLDDIFTIFTQVDGSKTRRYSGMGLGLNIAEKNVKLMGGDIRVESQLGQGSRFHFTARFGISLRDGGV